ncbi:MAG: transposon-encoded TnpW family protein [Oscillospiraceae bacterium]|nr:transposon-encoded TnpW family protein [Oscillospiraceae bacterium]
MTEIKNQTVKKIGKINYIVTFTSSENARETLEKKIERLVKKEVEKMSN